MNSNKINRVAETFLDILTHHAETQKAGICFRFLHGRGRGSQSMTFGELHARARAIGAFLQENGREGDRILLFFPPGLDYIQAFMGCLYAGMVAVPMYPPRPNRKLDRAERVVLDSGSRLALTTTSVAPLVQSVLDHLPEIKCHACDEIDTALAAQWQRPLLTDDTLAFLQYTSGSTGDPKGVMVSHGNLVANQRVIGKGFGTNERDVYLSWLPMYHDMGLIGSVLHPLYQGAEAILMSPLSFIRDPFYWLSSIQHYRATVCGGPNFAYDLCARHATPERLATLDLSSWRLAFSGSEPVRAVTLNRFCEAFAEAGFESSAIYPCYGMAEATLFVTGVEANEGYELLGVDAKKLSEDHIASPDFGDEALKLVSCGFPRDGHGLKIVDPDGLNVLDDGHVGEIWVSGPSVAQGYWQREQQTQEIFGAKLADGEGPFLRTGDLGFVLDGALYITGRRKELIIIRGRNHYPQDIEYTTATAHEALQTDAGAAFVIMEGEEELLVVVQEVRRTSLRSLDNDAVVEAVRQAVADVHELQIHDLVLVKPGRIPKTSSGKIQRVACRKAYESGSMEGTVSNNPIAGVWKEDPTGQPVPLTEDEQKARALIAEVVNIPETEIGRDTNLLSLGIDSIASVTLQHRLKELLGGAPPMVTLLRGATLSALVEACHTAKAEAQVFEQTVSNRLSRNQRALWFLYQMAPNSKAYNISFACDIEPPFDVARLKQAFGALIHRHPSLRTHFLTRDEKPRTEVLDQYIPHIEEVQARDLSDSALDTLLSDKANQPFDLEQGPLMRVHLFARGEDRFTMLLSFHHIVVDFWSLLTLMTDLGTLYEYGVPEGLERLGSLPAQYRHFVAGELHMLEQHTHNRAYWLNRLSGDLGTLQLPYDFPRPPIQSYDGAVFSQVLSPQLGQALNRLANEENTTLYVVLLSAFQSLLRRYTNQDDIIVGSPVANRDDVAFHNVVGYFVNPLVMRTDFSGNPTYLEILQQVRQNTLDDIAHGNYPFQSLVEELHPERDPSRSPLFSVMFTLLRPHRLKDATSFILREKGAPLSLGGLNLSSRKLEQRFSQFDFTLVTVEAPTGIHLSFEYNTSLFKEATIARMARALERFLIHIVDMPTAKVSRVPLVDDEDVKLMGRWNNTFSILPDVAAHHHLIEATAEKNPHDPAIAFGGEFGVEQLTYQQLDEQARRLAGLLQEMGVGPDVPVGICLRRTPMMITAMYAVLKAGGAYVPMDPNYPSGRIAYTLADAKAPVLLTETQLLGQLPKHSGITLTVDRLPAGKKTGFVAPTLSRNNLSHIIYTSGSTGQPKGVALTHGNVVSLLSWARQTFSTALRKGVMASTSICFDLSVFEIFGTLSWGGKIILVENALGVIDSPLRKEVTLINTVPSAITEILRLNGVPGNVRQINLAGEALKGSLVHLIMEETQIKRVFNLYGPSEDTTYSTGSLMEHMLKEEPTIGRPLDNTVVHLLNSRLIRTPIGVIGELYIQGLGLGRGYHNRPAMTAARFLPNPFGQAGSRMYATGDLARYTETGELQFLGRVDAQIKLRGFRIELGEVEVELARQEGVKDAAVLYRKEQSGGMLVGYVELTAKYQAQQRHLVRKQLSDALSEALPKHMVPSVLMLLDVFPRTPNGKIDRRALAAMALPKDMASLKTYTAPRSPIEELIASYFSDILSVERVGIHDDFFQLGGHSLLATRLLSRVRASFGVSLPVSSIFEAPTVMAFSERVDAAVHRHDENEIPPLVPAPVGEKPVLSFSQQLMWLLDRMGFGVGYNMPAALRLEGPLNHEALKASVEMMVNRHRILRSCYPEKDGLPTMVVRDLPSIPFINIDLSHLSPQDQERETQVIVDKETREPFDLSRDCLIRFGLIRLSPTSHIFMLTMHHIVSDGASVHVMIRDFAEGYSAFCSGREPLLPHLQLDYIDYAHWQRQWLQGPILERQLAFWQKNLAGAPDIIELPKDKTRNNVDIMRSGELSFEIDAELTKKLRDYALERRVSLFMVLFSAFKLLLARYTNTMDLVVGVPVANRGHHALDNLVGFFVNTLPLRTVLDADTTFVSLLEQVRDNTLTAYSHQDIPFEKLVEELNIERQLAHSPIYQVMFVLQEEMLREDNLTGLKQEVIPTSNGLTQFDWVFSLEEGRDRIQGNITYSTDLFHEATAVRAYNHYLLLLERVLEDPESSVWQVDLLTPEERHTLLNQLCQTSYDYGPDQHFLQAFQRQVQQQPNNVALHFGEQQVTYAELDRKANQVAHFLVAHPRYLNQPIGIYFRRCPEMIYAMLGVFKAGGAYLPIDPRYPLARRAFMLEDTQANLVLSNLERDKSIPESVSFLSLDNWENIHSQPQSEPSVEHFLESGAYIIYTSGSTGRPKGCVISHRNMMNMMHNYGTAFNLSSEESLLQFGSIGFDISVPEIFATLSYGAQLVLFDAEYSLTTTEFWRLVLQYKISSLQIPSSYWKTLVNNLDHEPVPSTVRTILVGGEKISEVHLQKWLEHVTSRVLLINAYGPTETTVAATWYFVTIDKLEEIRRRGTPIGQALENYRVYVVDNYLNPVPIGIPGELVIGGVGVGRGYLYRPSLTADRFIPDPFTTEEAPAEGNLGSGARLYKTGDLVRLLADGNIHYIGRTDHQVKIRGYRIELGEIQTLLDQHEAVKQGLVITVKSGEEHRLVGYVVLNHGFDETWVDDIQQSLGRDLPDYMVPEVFMIIDVFPRTVNDKLDIKALPKPEFRASKTLYAAPETATETLLAPLWNELLDVPSMGIDDNFFNLGGHSLLATQLASRIHKQLGIELPIRKIFEAPTIRSLAAYLDKQSSALRTTQLPIKPIPEDETIPLSLPQQRLWFLIQMEGPSATYNLPLALRIEGDLDPEVLKRALSAIVDRHEPLRMQVNMVGGNASLQAAKEKSLVVTEQDLTHLSTEEQVSQAELLISGDAVKSVDITQDLPFTALLLKRSDDYVLILNFHHMAADGWSMGVFVKELGEYYLAYRNQRPALLPDLEVSYRDYAYWQRQWLQGEELNRQTTYWQQQLAGHPVLLELPTDRHRPELQTFDGTVLEFSLSRSSSDRISRLSNEQGVSLFMSLLSIFNILLFRYSGQTDICVGTAIANRTRSELENMIGLFFNTLVLRTRIAPDVPFLELLSQVCQSTLEAYAHQDLPFDQVVEAVKPPRSLSHSPLFQVMFILQNTPMSTVDLPGLTMHHIPGPQDTAKFDITLNMFERDGCLHGRCEYNTNLFDASTIQAMMDQFQCLIDSVTQDPKAPVSSLEILPEPTLAHLNQLNDTAHAYDDQQTIHGLFTRQVMFSPKRPGLIFDAPSGPIRMDYASLERASNQMAHRLIQLGVNLGDRVGICLRRAPEMVIAMFGVLKAGAAYVPLDPNYPNERLTFVGRDAEISVLVTHRDIDILSEINGVNRVFSDTLIKEPEHAPMRFVPSSAPAYLIYTSGSTGKPKGVVVSHANVINLFEALDQGLDEPRVNDPGTWLATTSISFDISVLELFWTLARGWRVVLQPEPPRQQTARRKPRSLRNFTKGANLSLMYFAADHTAAGEDPYRLLKEGAKFADHAGLHSVWVPERHFHAFGGAYPNPSVAAALVAGMTERVNIRAGSVVMPLHDPIRIAEEWSMVDNFSNGRVGLAVASGWQPNDFVFFPERYETRKQYLVETIETVRSLWRGESLRREGPQGPLDVTIRPRPVQKELAIWVTAAGNPETFRAAGRSGSNVLTHMLGQNIKELEQKIQIYRDARAEAGLDPNEGQVTLMLHTFLGDDEEEVRKKVRGPFGNYLKTSLDLGKALADDAMGVDTSKPEHQELLVEHAFNRYSKTSALFGKPENCVDLVDQMTEIGVNEIACLIDFGVDEDDVIASFKHLGNLRELIAPELPGIELPDWLTLVDPNHYVKPAQLISRHGVTHFQCTPSYARMILADVEGPRALAGLRKMCVGGERFPADLAGALVDLNVPEIYNMYGPTETTVWSLDHHVNPVSTPTVPIGKPLCNTDIYVLDRFGCRVPPGVPGELYIGGDGVTRGYWMRPSLTSERFVPNGFSQQEGARLYRTGDLVYIRKDGRLEFLRRIDTQVKLHGHRIELGEIESLLSNDDTLLEAAASVLPDGSGHQRLVAFVVGAGGKPTEEGGLKQRLSASLPNYMLPSVFHQMDVLPKTPNGKIDRKALKRHDEEARNKRSERSSGRVEKVVQASSQTEEVLREIWCQLLELDSIGVNDNFFEFGGHSVLIPRLQNEVRARLGLEVSIVDLFRYPTIAQIAGHLEGAPKVAPAVGREPTKEKQKILRGNKTKVMPKDRAAKQRELVRQRRLAATKKRGS